jgi:hypothetical protein
VVRLGGGDEERQTAASTATPAPRPLDADLERALAALAAAGLDPTVVSVRSNDRGVSRAS